MNSKLFQQTAKTQNSAIDNRARKLYAISVIVDGNDNIYFITLISLPFKLCVYRPVLENNHQSPASMSPSKSKQFCSCRLLSFLVWNRDI
jgi:hypothetical protein